MSGTLDHVNLSIKLDSLGLSALDLDTVLDPLLLSSLLTLANGTGANQASQQWHDTRTLTASSTENLDLAGSLTNAFGVTLTFTRVKLLWVRAAVGNTNNVLVGGAASNGFINWVNDATDIVVVRPGGMFLTYAPDATAFGVTASTGDILKVANSSSGTSVTYDIVVVGCD